MSGYRFDWSVTPPFTDDPRFAAGLGRGDDAPVVLIDGEVVDPRTLRRCYTAGNNGMIEWFDPGPDGAPQIVGGGMLCWSRYGRVEVRPRCEQPATCTCSIQTLLITGCRCGGS